jgi:hypothetical protein
MIREINYHEIRQLVQYTLSLENATIEILSDSLSLLPTADLIDSAKGTINAPLLANALIHNDICTDFLKESDTGHIPAMVYAFLYVRSEWHLETTNIRTYELLKDKLNKDTIPAVSNYLYERILFAALALRLEKGKIPWSEFVDGFTGQNWTDIHLLAEVLPTSGANAIDAFQWLSIVVQQQEGDGALGSIAPRLYEWVIGNASVANEINEQLQSIATDKRIIRFFAPLIKGIKEKLQKKTTYFQEKLEPVINLENAYFVLYGLGMISLETGNDRDNYFNLLLSKLDQHKLALHEFISICNYLKIYRKELFDRIEETLPSSEDISILRAIIELLRNDAENKIGDRWKRDSAHLLVSKSMPELTRQLDYFLMHLAESNLDLAYDLFEFRLKVMADLNLLKSALVQMVRKDITLFHYKLIGWFIQEDHHLHTGIRGICGLYDLDKSLFNIPTTVFSGVCNKEKLYIAYKIAGYIYSMDEMQRLFLSLVKSVTEDNDVLYAPLHFILSEYIIYNYRSTLEVIRNELKNESSLSSFASKLYTQLIEEYETYFSQLRGISVKKELTPYKDHLLYKSFYMRKQFADIPKKPEQNSITSLFKNTQLNSNRWAIRRPEQTKHIVQELSHISVSTEFPSGENLNPVFQEYIRRTYQNIRKNEINID